MGTEAGGPTSDPDALSPQAVQLALSTVCSVVEQLLQASDQVVFLDQKEGPLKAVLDPQMELDPGLREQMQRILEELREARHLMRVQLRDPPTDLWS